MSIVEWFKTNLIIILAVALGVTFVFGSIGTLWYKNAAERADLRAQVAESNLSTALTVNKGFEESVNRQSKGLEDVRAACGATLTAAERTERAVKAGKRDAQPFRDLAAALESFKPPPNTALQPCAAERAVLDQFFSKRSAR